MYNGHRCLVFEQLHYNLYDILRYNNFTGMNIRHVQRIAYQVGFVLFMRRSFSVPFVTSIVTKTVSSTVM